MGQEGRGLKEVTLASRASSALTPILTPLTLISRTQLEGGLKCTVSLRVVAICTREGWGHVGSCFTMSQHRLQIPESLSPILWAG